MKKIFLLWLIFSHALFVLAQEKKYTLSGYVSDFASNEKLISANIYNPSALTGTVSNLYGFYSLTLPEGSYQITYSYVGYQPQTISVDLTKNQFVNVQLQFKTIGEITVVGGRVENKVLDSQMSKESISMEMVKSLPAFMGEADVMKALQLMPGVQSGSEGTSGLYVRGGGPDQNLLLLDGVPVYNASHLFGFFSVFNPDAVKNVSLYKGGFPARFGGRLSSVVDIRMKEGNEKEIHGGVQVGLISSKVFVEGPIKKDRTAFHFSARRTYVDAITRPIMKNDETQAGYFFYDMNAKVNHKFSEKDRVYLSAYFGRDKATVKDAYEENSGYYSDDNYVELYSSDDRSKIFWGNITSAVRWNHIYNPKLFSNTTITYSKYSFQVSNDSKEWEDNELRRDVFYRYKSGIDDVAAKIEIDWYPHLKHQIKFGSQLMHHLFTPGVETYNGDDSEDNDINLAFGDQKTHANEINLFIEDDWEISSRLKANIGLHFSGFDVEQSLYTSIEPRASLRFLVNDKLSLKASYAKMQQYLHLLSNSTVGLPTDLWLPSTQRIKPQLSHQVAIGAAYHPSLKYTLSAETFYKKMDNLIEYKEGASFFGSSTGWEDKVEVGQGESYGVELMVRKDVGKTSGWIGYTWAKTNRQFDNLNMGNWFPARYDRRNDVSIVLSHKPNDRIDFGATWVFGTGNALTIPTHNVQRLSVFSYDYEEMIPYQEGRNNYRMPNYHRLDFGVNFHKKKKHGIRTWNISVYNVYNRQNPFYIYIDESEYTSQKKVKQVSLFPILPSISYSYTF
nr:TonB-dependent receptor [uncultured Carboxylicivirga sp.]